MLCWSRVLLLLYVLLLAAATEDSEEQQKEEEDEIDYMTFGEEGQPLNVTVEAVSSTALNVSWDPPDEEPQYYEVTDVRDSFNELAYTTYCLIDELQPCKTYFYTVASHYGNKQYASPPTSGTTLASVPPPPLNCDFDRITTNSMYLTWSAPDTACHIRNYNISWSWSSLWEDDHDSDETLGIGTQTYLRGLPPYANVTVNIAAATDAGFGPPITCWSVTQQDKPGPPVNVTATTADLAVSVTWEKPEKTNGIITNYVISVSEQDTTVDGETTNVTIPDLQKCKLYNITVMAATVAGCGEATDPLPVFFNDSVLPSDVKCNLSGSNVMVTWQQLLPQCPPSSYNISWSGTSLWSDDTDTNSSSMDWTNEDPLSYELPHSLPYTNYSVCVSVDGYTSDTGCCQRVTPQAKPGPPVNVTATTADHAVSVTWEKPEKTNGIITNYIISVSEEDTTVDGETTTVNIPDLEKCKLYNITVMAATVAGWGEATDPLPVFFNDTDLPSSVKCDLSGSNVMVTWQQLHPQCPPSSYNISWSGTSLWSDDTDTNSSSMDWMNEDPLRYELPHSLPYTKYSVCVSVDGYTSDTGCCQRVTPQATPGPPELLNLHNDKTSLIVKWTEPEEKNGIIDEYRITWTDSKGTSNSTTIPKESCCSHTINNLTPCENYTVSVSAHTVDWGEESPTKKTFIPNFVTDSGLKCDGSNSREAHISWSLAVHDCLVDEYFLNWTTTVQWNGHHNSNSATIKGGGAPRLVLRGLEPDTEFDVCLTVDEAGSNMACCTSTTRPDKPSQPKNLKMENKTQTTVTLSWSLPDQLNGILEGWQLTWSPNTEDEGIVLAISKRAYTVTNLKPSTNYTFDLMAGNGAGYGDAAEIIVTTKPPDNNNTAIIIGASVGGVLLVVILVASSVYVYRNKSRKTSSSSKTDTSVGHNFNGQERRSFEMFEGHPRDYNYNGRKQAPEMYEGHPRVQIHNGRKQAPEMYEGHPRVQIHNGRKQAPEMYGRYIEQRRGQM
ncbi:receptor-type tyrosine-protein phosphatase delta-like isoform X1 [Homarus americanus]|uniref:receptor-type tyrosine-protein phosphatase delta-like isoform X1 n=1 Tax=Homarus americanus TaxID=6706 RepID=UPI001C479494|nr:receptor-type tyrosine-protein phosphatase delta-like isoform X1 [Homarus americanus]